MHGNINNISFEIKKNKLLENGGIYNILIVVPMDLGWIENMNFVVENDGINRYFEMKHIKNKDDKVYFETEIMLETKAIYHYYFSFEANNKLLYFKKNNITGNSNISLEEAWRMSVNFNVPDWAKGKIMYHIFVDRFKKSNDEKLNEMPRRIIHKKWDEDMTIGPTKEGLWNIDFYGGDLKGIENSLDYIKSLGVSILYLSPVVYSQSNHRYDSADYEQVDPYLGDNNDLKSLCEKAHKYGIKVILDAVFNHTGNDSKYFNELSSFDTLGAYQSELSPYYDFYRKEFNNNKPHFCYWWGMKNLPVCDGNSKSWQEYIYGKGGIIDQWFDLGIDGLRLDVADELTDEFIEEIRKAVKRNKEDGFILGEVWKNPMRMGRGYIESGKGMDSVMNYVLVDALIKYFKYADTKSLEEVIKQIKTEYPESTMHTLMNFTSTHDITRAINIFSSDIYQRYGEWAWDLNNKDYEWCKNYILTDEQYKTGKEIYKSYIYALAFLPGILSIFYGDEVGVQGVGNLSNRKPFPWNSIDNELLSFFKEIGHIRREESFLETADIKILSINEKYFLFERTSKEEKAAIAINRTNNIVAIAFPSDYLKPDKIYSLNDSKNGELNPHGALVLKKRAIS